jgi:Glycosyltransferase family 87
VYGSPQVDPQIGSVNSGGYFPWSFFAQFLFIPNLPWRVLRIYFALLNLISLFVLARFAYQIGSPYGKSKAFFSVAACLAISSYSTTLYLGQYGIIINALLIGTFWCLKYKQQAWAGLLLGLAMTKLNIAAFYIFVPIALAKLNTLRVLLGYFIVANISIWAITKVDPALLMCWL